MIDIIINVNNLIFIFNKYKILSKTYTDQVIIDSYISF